MSVIEVVAALIVLLGIFLLGAVFGIYSGIRYGIPRLAKLHLTLDEMETLDMLLRKMADT